MSFSTNDTMKKSNFPMGNYTVYMIKSIAKNVIKKNNVY